MNSGELHEEAGSFSPRRPTDEGPVRGSARGRTGSFVRSAVPPLEFRDAWIFDGCVNAGCAATENVWCVIVEEGIMAHGRAMTVGAKVIIAHPGHQRHGRPRPGPIPPWRPETCQRMRGRRIAEVEEILIDINLLAPEIAH